MISTPRLAPDSRNVSGFPSLTCDFTGSLPFASYPGREATTPPLASLSGISTRRRPHPIHSAVHSFWYVWVSVSCLWLWCDRKRARGKFSNAAACAFGAIPRLRGPPHLHCVQSCGIKEPVQGPLLLLLHTASSRAWRLERPYQRVRPAGPPPGKILSIGLPWWPSWRRQPSCWQSPFGYYRWRAAGRVCSVHGLMHTSGRDAAPPQNTLSGVKCVAFSVAVSM